MPAGQPFFNSACLMITESNIVTTVKKKRKKQYWKIHVLAAFFSESIIIDKKEKLVDMNHLTRISSITIIYQ